MSVPSSRRTQPILQLSVLACAVRARYPEPASAHLPIWDSTRGTDQTECIGKPSATGASKPARVSADTDPDQPDQPGTGIELQIWGRLWTSSIRDVLAGVV